MELEAETETETETETIPRKRKGAPNSALATEPDLEDEEPKAKKARLSSILFAENDVITPKQLCELLKYAVLGKSTPEPRNSACLLRHPVFYLISLGCKGRN